MKLGSPPCIIHETSIWKGSHNPILRGRALTMIMNHLQIMGWSFKQPTPRPAKTKIAGLMTRAYWKPLVSLNFLFWPKETPYFWDHLGGGFKYVLFSPRKLGKRFPIYDLRIFFKWVGKKPPTSHGLSHEFLGLPTINGYMAWYGKCWDQPGDSSGSCGSPINILADANRDEQMSIFLAIFPTKSPANEQLGGGLSTCQYAICK